jgi:hypothetical protein
MISSLAITNHCYANERKAQGTARHKSACEMETGTC